MANHTTGAQRYNDRMDKIWDSAILLKQKNCKHHFVIRKYNKGSVYYGDKTKYCEHCGVKK